MVAKIFSFFPFFLFFAALPYLFGQSSFEKLNSSFDQVESLLDQAEKKSVEKNFNREAGGLDNDLNPFLIEKKSQLEISFKKNSMLFGGREGEPQPVEIVVSLRENLGLENFDLEKNDGTLSLDDQNQPAYENLFRFFLSSNEGRKNLIPLRYRLLSKSRHLDEKGDRIYRWNILIEPAQNHYPQTGLYNLIAEMKKDAKQEGVFITTVIPRAYRVSFPKRETSVFFIVDNSRSMIQSDPKAKRFEKIKEIIFNPKGLSGVSSVKRFAILSFAGGAEEVVPLFPINSLDVQKKQKIIEALQTVAKKTSTQMDTSYAAAFSGVKKLIEETKKKRRYEQFAVVFLTDGVTTKPYANEHRYLGKDIPIFTVGLNAALSAAGKSHAQKSYDETILKRIAKESGGSFFQVDENIMHSIYSLIINRVAKHFEKIKIIKKKDQYLEQELIAISFDKIDTLPALDVRARLGVLGSGKKKPLEVIEPFFYDRKRELILFSPRQSGRYQLRLDFLARKKIIEAKTIFFEVKKSKVDYVLATQSTRGNLFFFDVNPLKQQVHYLTISEGDHISEGGHLSSYFNKRAEKHSAFDPASFRFFLIDACHLHASKEELQACFKIDRTITFESSLLFPPSKKTLPSYAGGSRRAIKFSPLREMPDALMDLGKYAWHGYLLVEQPNGWFVHDMTVNYQLPQGQPRYDLFSYEKGEDRSSKSDLLDAASLDDRLLNGELLNGELLNGFASIKQVGLSLFLRPWQSSKQWVLQSVKKYWPQLRNDSVLHFIANGLFVLTFFSSIYLFYCFYTNQKRKKI